MTYILDKQQKCLREKANPLIEKPVLETSLTDDIGNEMQRQQSWLYDQHIASLKSYPILLEQWEDYEHGAEVEDGEFELKEIVYRDHDYCGDLDSVSKFAIPKQKQVSQSELWEDVIDDYMNNYFSIPFSKWDDLVNILNSKYIILPSPHLELLLQEVAELKELAAELEELKKYVAGLPNIVPTKLDL